MAGSLKRMVLSWIIGIFIYYSFVVPYNPYLVKRFNAHINVECVSGIRVIKYLYKYIFKGHDSATAEMAYGNFIHVR